MLQKPCHSKLALSVTAVILAACGTASAYDVPLTCLNSNLPPLTFHGFASQGFLDTSSYNYLASDTRGGSFQFSEMGLNVSMNPFPNTRVAIQGFDYDLGNVNEYQPYLDYALVEYTVNDEIGFRGGRLRRPQGIYNDIQDIDVARAFVLLPQGMYDSRFRDWSANLDGVEMFGNLPLGQSSKFGSISYEIYAGMLNMSLNGGFAEYINYGWHPFGGSVTRIEPTQLYGGQVWYNAPIDGLRFGASFAYYDDYAYDTVEGAYRFHTDGDTDMEQFSAEYVWKNWTFQAEYYTYDFTGHIYFTAPASLSGRTLEPDEDLPRSWYVAASYRFNKYIEAGAYYTQFSDFMNVHSPSQERQNDAALSLRVDLTPWWLFKVEGHVIEGTGLLRDDVNNPVPQQNKKPWYMLAVKTTLSF